MRGRIDSSFITEQRDLFTSGTVAEIGVSAYAVWSAIKTYADFNTGEAWPGMRTIGEAVGLSKSSVDRAVEVLKQAHMLRITKGYSKSKGQTYIARERLTVRLGNRVICVIVVDYVPSKLRGQIRNIEKALTDPKPSPEVFADVEILPGEGFSWDGETLMLRGRIAASELPNYESTDETSGLEQAVFKRIELLKN